MRKLFLLLPLLIVMPTILADDGSGCPTPPKFDTSSVFTDPYQGQFADCYSPQIYHQNQQLIKMNAIEICQLGDIYGGGSISYEYAKQKQWFNECVIQVLNDTK